MFTYTIIIALAALAVPLHLIYNWITNIFFHPLSAYPGPWLWAASRIPHTWHSLRGTLPFRLREIHAQYGPVVRIGPKQVFYTSDRAWTEIYGHITRTKTLSYPKDPMFYLRTPSGASTIINADDADHRRFRKLQAHAFSEKALVSQEEILQGHVHGLLDQLNRQIAGPRNGTVALDQWYNFCTFDVIGDLSFGESFHNVEQGEMHPQIKTLYRTLRANNFMRASQSFPAMTRLLKAMIPKDLVMKRLDFINWANNKASTRMDSGSTRPDFMTYMLRNNLDRDKGGMTVNELREAAVVLLVAGSETTSTTLTAATYYLLTHPSTFEKLKQEVRTAFQHQSDITMLRVAKLKYLNACLEEALRIFAPAPFSLPRVVPLPGDTICDRWVPAGTSVGVNIFAAGTSDANFVDGKAWRPERWLGDPKYKSDSFGASQPFSAGPRNCIGINLAYAEMRLILASVIFNFELELCSESKDWLENCFVYALWEKPDLMVKLRKRVI